MCYSLSEMYRYERTKTVHEGDESSLRAINRRRFVQD